MLIHHTRRQYLKASATPNCHTTKAISIRFAARLQLIACPQKNRSTDRTNVSIRFACSHRVHEESAGNTTDTSNC